MRMRDDSDREPWCPNFEGAPKLMYEVWSWQRRLSDGRVLWPEEQYWHFVGYRTLSLRQVLKYAEFGYHVERSKGRDHCGTPPLFPRLGTTGPGSPDWVD